MTRSKEEINAILDAEFGGNPLENLFPDNLEKQWITAALVTLGALQNQLEESGKANIMEIVSKAPLDCLLAAVTLSTRMNEALSQ